MARPGSVRSVADYAGDFRPLAEWGNLRSVCHGCRQVGYELEHDEHGTALQRPIVVPGDGTITRMVAGATEAGELPVVVPCPVCGESATPGWISGLVPPV